MVLEIKVHGENTLVGQQNTPNRTLTRMDRNGSVDGLYVCVFVCVCVWGL